MTEISDPKRVGYRIREIRKQLGLSMTAFANKIDDKSKSGTVSNWETGKNLPNNERLKRIAELGGISIDELLLGSLEDVVYSIMSDVAKLKRFNFKNKESFSSKEEELLTEIEMSFFTAITSRQFNESEEETDFSSLSDSEKIELIKKRKKEEQETIQHLISISVNECEEKKVSISDRISILECMKTAIFNYAYKQEYTTEGLINFLHSELDYSLMKAVNYVYLPGSDKKRETIDDEISEKAYIIVSDAMDKLNDLTKDL